MAARTLKLNYKGRTYELEYTRESVRQMESRGFRLEDIFEKPMSTLPVLFAGAFIAHHPKELMTEINKMFDAVTNKTDLLSRLRDMYNEPIDALLEEPDVADSEKATWESDW